jgi:hypothetical protein
MIREVGDDDGADRKLKSVEEIKTLHASPSSLPATSNYPSNFRPLILWLKDNQMN